VSPSPRGPDDAIATPRRYYDLRAPDYLNPAVRDVFMYGVGTPD
jgi:hypothetical protein